MSDSVKKRAASEEADGDPSKKKTKLDPEVNEVDEVAKPPKKPFNPLSPLPTLDRPASHLFVFGNGDSGQFGLGTDVTGDISRPSLAQLDGGCNKGGEARWRGMRPAASLCWRDAHAGFG